MVDRSRSPSRGQWPRRVQEFSGCLLDLTGEELRVGAMAAAGAPGHATAPQSTNDPVLASRKASRGVVASPVWSGGFPRCNPTRSGILGAGGGHRTTSIPHLALRRRLAQFNLLHLMCECASAFVCASAHNIRTCACARARAPACAYVCACVRACLRVCV
jgi:hypothetical protein